MCAAKRTSSPPGFAADAKEESKGVVIVGCIDGYISDCPRCGDVDVASAVESAKC